MEIRLYGRGLSSHICTAEMSPQDGASSHMRILSFNIEDCYSFVVTDIVPFLRIFVSFSIKIVAHMWTYIMPTHVGIYTHAHTCVCTCMRIATHLYALHH